MGQNKYDIKMLGIECLKSCSSERIPIIDFISS